MQGTCRVRAGYMQGTCRVRAGYVQGTCRVRAGYVQGTCRVHAGYVQGTCRVHAGYVQGTCRVHAGYVQGTCRVRAGCMQGTCRVQDLRTCDQQDMVDREMIRDGSEGDETVRSMSVADRRRGRHFSLLGKHPQPPLLHALNGHRGGGKSTQTRSPSALPA